MKLQQSPFEKIRRGIKTIEIRLNDEKRQELEVGDTIKFSLIDQPEVTIKTEVLELLHFATFKELFEVFTPASYGSSSQDEWEKMYRYYPKAKEAKYGVLGIRLKYLGEAQQKS
jgi:ASC-1-like (ASCH) protein